MYRISQHSNNIENTLTNEVFPQDDTHVLYAGYFEWLQNGGTPEIVPYFESEEVEMKTSVYVDIINNLVDELTTRALSSAIGKQGTRTYLESQEKIYREKNNVAIGLTVNSSMTQTITDEMNRDYPDEEDLDNLLIAYGITPNGTKYEKFCAFIAFRYAYGAQMYGFFISLVEDFRTCSLTHVERADFEKVDLVIEIAKNIPFQVTQEQLLELRAKMLAI